jgi:type II secretory pathway pseudopilin PulG
VIALIVVTGLLGALAAGIVGSQQVAAQEAGQRWEYIVVTVGLISENNQAYFSVSGAVTVDFTYGDSDNPCCEFANQLNEYGIEGWELVTVTELHTGTSYEWRGYMKRPVV